MAEKTGDITAERSTGGQIDDVLFVSSPTVTLSFPANSTSTPRERTVNQTVTLRTNHDADAEDEVASITATVSGDSGAANPDAASLMINDDEEQTYKLTLDAITHTPSAPPTENMDIKVKLEADPLHFDVGETLTLHVLDANGDRAAGYTATGSAIGMAEIGMMGDDPQAPDNINRRTITIAQTHTGMSDGNRLPDTITLEADSGSGREVRREDSLAIDVVDVHQLPAASTITAVAKDERGQTVTEIVEDGDPVYLTITVDRSAATRQPNVTEEELNIDIRPDDFGSYDVAPPRTTVGTGRAELVAADEIAITARADENVNDDELVLSFVVSGQEANGTGESVGTFTIPVVDNTATKVSPKSLDEAYPVIMAAMKAGAGDDEKLNPGESFSVMTSDLFTVMDGYTAAYGASVDGGGVSVSASGDTITVDAMSATDGEAKVTVTATAKMAGSSFIPSQTVSNIAEITFPVTVVDKALVVTVAADPAEIMEGGTSTITATANRAVEAGDGAVEIGLEVVGDATLDANSITIAMGDMSGSAMLTAAEDDDYADETVTVIATGSGIDAARQVAIAVMDSDEAPVDPEPANTIWPRSQDDAYPVITDAIEMGAGEDGLNPGESFSVTASALFEVMDGYEASYSASADSDAASASVSGDSVTVMADAAGAAKVTIRGTSTMASSSFAPEQVATNVADITFEVMVVDTALVVTVAADPAEIMEGGASTITATANRAVTAGDGAVEIGLEVVGDATVEPESITIAMGDMSGSTMLTAAEDDDYEDETVTVVATGSGIDAARQVTIAVTDNDAAPEPPAALVVTLGMPANVMDGNIVEGESYDITVSANRMVTEDTEVMIMRDRAASGAGDSDFTVSSATIMAGYDSATATLMVTEDNDPDSGTNDNMGESLVLFGMVDGEQTNSLTFTIWDQAVPALPLLGQLLLALFLMLGGARLYRRRQG